MEYYKVEDLKKGFKLSILNKIAYISIIGNRIWVSNFIVGDNNKIFELLNLDIDFVRNYYEPINIKFLSGKAYPEAEIKDIIPFCKMLNELIRLYFIKIDKQIPEMQYEIWG